jgi:hypothetical protein
MVATHGHDRPVTPTSTRISIAGRDTSVPFTTTLKNAINLIKAGAAGAPVEG